MIHLSPWLVCLLYNIPTDLYFTSVTCFFILFFFALRSQNQRMDSSWICYKQLGVWCNFNSRDWILHLFPLFSGGDVEIASNFAKNVMVPLFGKLSLPNGSTYENGKIFFRKKDNHAAFWCKICKVSLYPFLRNRGRCIGGTNRTTASYEVSRNSSLLVQIMFSVCLPTFSFSSTSLQCFDAVGWAAERASGL